MMVTHGEFNPEKTEVFQTSSLKIQTTAKFHFQVDGEYLGKVNRIEANIIEDAMMVIVPVEFDA